jgi:hypothetical protein
MAQPQIGQCNQGLPLCVSSNPPPSSAGGVFSMGESLRAMGQRYTVTGDWAIETLSVASRTRPWLAAGWGCRGQRLSIA